MNGKTKIPVVFAFDENYVLPASVAISSLVEKAKEDVEYEIIVLHEGLSESVKREFEKISPIKWIGVPKKAIIGFPCGWSGRATWFRIMIAELLEGYKRVIWSDVDVLFCDDISEAFSMEMNGAQWAGVYTGLNGVDEKLYEGRKGLYLPGFMVVDLNSWKDMCFWEKAQAFVKEHFSDLKSYDLDVLNMVAQKKESIPLKYCVFERLVDNEDFRTVPEYAFLRDFYSDEEIENARKKPAIIHYAGPGMKIWLRRLRDMHEDYRNAVIKSPFWDEDREKSSLRSFWKYFVNTLKYFATRNIKFRRQAGIYKRAVFS